LSEHIWRPHQTGGNIPASRLQVEDELCTVPETPVRLASVSSRSVLGRVRGLEFPVPHPAAQDSRGHAMPTAFQRLYDCTGIRTFYLGLKRTTSKSGCSFWNARGCRRKTSRATEDTVDGYCTAQSLTHRPASAQHPVDRTKVEAAVASRRRIGRQTVP